MIDQLQLLAERLQDAEYLHVFLETLPLYGILFGLIFYGASLVLKSPKIRPIALVVIAVSALSTYSQVRNRRLAEPHMIQVHSADYGARIQAQTSLRASKQWAYLALAAGCGLTFATRKSKLGPVIRTATLVGAGAAVLLTAWIQMKEAEVLHPNIQLGPGTKAKAI